MRLRRLLLIIHSYSGVICFWYLIILGTSSLYFNHHFSFMEPNTETEEWSQHLQLEPEAGGDLALAESIRDSLGLIGWPLPWEIRRDSTGLFHFALQHPGKRYVFDYHTTDRVVQVQETSRGFWRTLNAMHGVGAVPQSAFMDAWKWYTRATVVLVIFSVVFGIYLWYSGRRDKRSALYTLLACLLLSVAWMFQLYYSG